jgi:signal transduction histidine kinase/DNA-binding NarL/FixJ family response regulator
MILLTAMQSIKSAPTQFLTRLPLRWVLVLPFVLQISAAVSLTGYWSLRNGQQAVNDLADQLTTEVSDRIDLHLESYLDVPKKMNQQNNALIQLGMLDMTNFETVGKHFWKQVPIYGVNYIQYGTRNGEYIGAGDYGDGQIKIEEIPLGKPGTTFKYDVDAQGERTRLVDQGEFEPRNEPWYLNPRDTLKPSWGNIYNWETNPEIMSVPAAIPVLNRQGKFIGAMGIDVNLATVSQFLNRLKIGKSGKAFILERSGLLVATSAAERPYRLVEDKAERLKAEETRDKTIQATARYLNQQFSNLNTIQTNKLRITDINGQRHYIKISPWKDDQGLDWLVILAIPESDFMAQIHANTRTTILLCLGALGLATVLGIYTSRWISRPIQRLNLASEAIAAGNLDQQVEAQGIAELGSLASAFNHMAQQLRESFTALENTNAELEQRVEVRTAELKDAMQAADNANHAKSDFLANMSHELRTPLNGILGYSQILLRDRTIAPKQKDGVNIIHQCGSHLLTLINDILDLSKIEARKLELTPKDTHFESFMYDLVQICRVRAEQKDIAFVYETRNALPVAIHVDDKRLRQVLINLLGNAIKFTDRGNVTLKVGAMEATSPDYHRLRFQIEDTGVGMTHDQLQKIFLSFEQVGDKQRMTEGTGLGLAISQEIIHLMGSEFQVESVLDKGSTFWFEVEVLAAKDWMEAPTFAKGQIIGYQEEKQTILVIDDRWENRAVLVNLLEPLGFEIIEAANGQEGIEQLAQASEVRLVITDIAMPVMNGLEMIQVLRTQPANQTLPIIVSSASVFNFDRQQSHEAGANDFLPKPVQSDELFDQLRHYLNLTWIYENAIGSEPTLQRTSEADLIIPSATELQDLYTAARIGDIRGIEQAAQQIQQLDSSYQGFVHRILTLAADFDDRAILKFIKSHIETPATRLES